jgi:hypothetical protein
MFMIMFIFHARIVLSGNINNYTVHKPHLVPSTPLTFINQLFVGGQFSVKFGNKLYNKSDEVPEALEEKHAFVEG